MRVGKTFLVSFYVYNKIYVVCVNSCEVGGVCAVCLCLHCVGVASGSVVDAGCCVYVLLLLGTSSCFTPTFFLMAFSFFWRWGWELSATFPSPPQY